MQVYTPTMSFQCEHTHDVTVPCIVLPAPFNKVVVTTTTVVLLAGSFGVSGAAGHLTGALQAVDFVRAIWTFVCTSKGGEKAVTGIFYSLQFGNFCCHNLPKLAQVTLQYRPPPPSPSPPHTKGYNYNCVLICITVCLLLVQTYMV